MPDILLTTINARYRHASLGLRCLLANLGDLEARAELVEFVVGSRTEDLVERLLARQPRIVAIGVYIWNVNECTRLVAQLKRVAPEVIVVLGGPEVSHEIDAQRICALADHVIAGPGEGAFAALCRTLIDGSATPPKLIRATPARPDTLELPYRLYSDRDIRDRLLYIEASRGCPFKCEFCLSSLDRSAEPFDLERLLGELARLYARGARQFKFVDRTFNLKIASSLRILDFLLERIADAPEDPVFAHFELVPDHLPERLRESIRRFPPGTLQLEIGIQTWNPEVQTLISRRQDDRKAAENLAWLARESNAHLHVDLIAGLPAEDFDGFGAGFDKLVGLGPHEIQVGILKRLRGAPIARHTAAFGLRFNPDPPYNVLATDRIPFAQMQRLSRFARYWDLIGNSGRFPRTLPLLLADRPFARFVALSDWLHARTGATHRIAAERQYELVRQWLIECGGEDVARIDDAIVQDFAGSGVRGHPAFLPKGIAGAQPAARGAPKRQSRYLAA